MSLVEIIKEYEVLPVSGKNPVILNLRVAKTETLYQFLESKPFPIPADPENIFGSEEFSIGLFLARGLTSLGLASNMSVYQTNLVIYLGVVENTDLFHLVNKFSAGSVSILSNLYKNPEVVINVYCPPANHVISYQRHWQLCWFAHLRRCLGEMFGNNIPKSNRLYSPKELQEQFESDPNFSWDLIPEHLKYGYQFYNGNLVKRNFLRGTAGDLF